MDGFIKKVLSRLFILTKPDIVVKIKDFLFFPALFQVLQIML
jgi:hypothetical protein